MIIGKTRTNQPVESDAGLDAKLVNLPLPATSGQGGKVLAVNSGGTGYELKTIEGATELWFHGIELYGSGKAVFEMHILNNSNASFDTIAKVKTWAENITGEVRIQGNGAIKVSDTWYPIILIYKSSDNQWDIYYLDATSGSLALSNIDLADYFDTTITDARNQLL